MPPIADKTRAFKVKAGDYLYARVYKEDSGSKPRGMFILRYDDIKGLNAIQIAEKYALPQIPDKIVFIRLPPELPLEVSIVGPQESWGTLGGSVQYAIKYVPIEPSWFYKTEVLK